MLPGAAIVSPRGDVSEHGAARFFRRTGEGVYDMDDLAVRTAKDGGLHPRPSRRRQKPSATIGLGYSNGANILASVLFADPALFDAAVLMHPLIPFEPDIRGDLTGKRILITAGRRDPICPPDLTSRLEAHLRAAGPMSQWNGTRAATRCGRTRSRRHGVSWRRSPRQAREPERLR